MHISPPQWKMRNFMEESKGALFLSPHCGIPYDTTRQGARPFWCSVDACVDLTLYPKNINLLRVSYDDSTHACVGLRPNFYYRD